MVLPVPAVARLLRTADLLERCFDASERARLGGPDPDPGRVAARLAAKAAASEVMGAGRVWPGLDGRSGDEPLALPDEETCARMRAAVLSGPGVPDGPDTAAPELSVPDHGRDARGGGRGRLLVSLSHDADLAAALVLDAGQAESVREAT